MIDGGRRRGRGANDPSNPFPRSGPAHRPEDWRLTNGRQSHLLRRRTGLAQIVAGTGLSESEHRDRQRSHRRWRRRRPARQGSWTAVSGLGLGVAMICSKILVHILGAVVVTSAEGGWTAFGARSPTPRPWTRIGSPSAWPSVGHRDQRVHGHLIAWVLVPQSSGQSALRGADRTSRSPCRRSSPVSCCSRLYGPDSPLGVNVANTRTAAVFLAVPVRDAAVHRAHGPARARARLDREVEEAARSLGA